MIHHYDVSLHLGYKHWVATVCLSLDQLPLELTQSFVRNIDGSYSPFRCPDPPCESEAVAMGYRTDKPQVIRPLELRTFLKVGENRPHL